MKITYQVHSNTTGYGSFWRQETGGTFRVNHHGGDDYPTDTDAREAAINYADAISNVGLHVRVTRTAEEFVYDSWQKDQPDHQLSFTGHEHLGPAKHEVTARCACGDAYQSTSKTTLAARNNIREKHKRHLQDS